MSVQKVAFNIDKNHFQLGMAFSKVDKVNRLVHGFATLDNTDSSDEVVMSDASTRAFEKWRGNIREMHQPIAAGHAVSITQETYYDPKTEKFYDGIYATVYVSLGAESTWQKVLDGTLTGFSIGGNITEAETQYVADLEKTVRFIKEYDLIELSLVDNPCNQLANVFSITKSADGTTLVKGMIADTKTENVFYCKTDEIVKTSTEEAYSCPECSGKMTAAGWFEYDDTNKAEKLRDVVQKYLTSENSNNEGGVDVVVENTEETVVKAAAVVTEEVVPVVDEVTEVVADEVVETEVVAEVEAPADEAANVSEVADEDNNLAKMFDGLKTDISASLEKNADALQEALGGLNTRLDTVTTDVETNNTELLAKFEAVSTELAELKERLDTTEKSLTVIDGATALRKSSDLGGSTETVVEKSTTSVWGGHFLGADSLLQN